MANGEEMTTTPEQIEAVARAMCDTEWGEGYWDEVMPYARREYKRQAASAINAMRLSIRAEVLEEAARICDEADVKEREFFVGADNAIDEVIYDRGSCVARISAAAIRALKDT